MRVCVTKIYPRYTGHPHYMKTGHYKGVYDLPNDFTRTILNTRTILPAPYRATYCKAPKYISMFEVVRTFFFISFSKTRGEAQKQLKNLYKVEHIWYFSSDTICGTKPVKKAPRWLCVAEKRCKVQADGDIII